MDAEKLSNLLDDLKSEEDDEISINLTELRDYFNQSMKTTPRPPDLGENIDNKYSEISDKCSASSINELSISDFKILKKIEGTHFYGSGLFEHLDNILSTNKYNTQNIVDQLNKFIESRNDFVKNVNQILEAFKKFSIKSYFFTDDIYQIGVLIPDKGTFTTIPALEKQLHNWNFVLKLSLKLQKKTPLILKLQELIMGASSFTSTKLPK